MVLTGDEYGAWVLYSQRIELGIVSWGLNQSGFDFCSRNDASSMVELYPSAKERLAAN